MITHDQAVFVSLSMIMLILYYGIICIGWYFSTDYFDKYVSMFPYKGDALFVFCIKSAIIIADVIILFNDDWNLFNRAHLMICTALWILIVIPLLITVIIKSRKYLRKKRGKL